MQTHAEITFTSNILLKSSVLPSETIQYKHRLIISEEWEIEWETKSKIAATKLKIRTKHEVRFYDARIINEHIQMIEVLFNPLKYR